ncbi:MAG: tetratricopeptide repeat protein, partial [Pseudohongiellaceae bacterium]
LVLLGGFSWRQWQGNLQADAEQASQLYGQLADIASGNPALEVPEEDFSTAEFINEQLHADFADTIYARYGSLFMARLHVRSGDLDGAERELSWILDNPDLGLLQRAGEEILLTARLRLARVVLAKGEAERALQLLNNADPGPYVAAYLEVEGDIYMAMGQIEDARSAWQEAAANGANSAILELKLRDLGEA